MNQRPGFPNASIKLFSNINDWQDNKYTDMSMAFITLTMRDTIYGTTEGMLQVYDSGKLHTRLTGNEFIMVNLSNANSNKIQTRIYGIKSTSVAVDKKADTIVSFNLCPWHESLSVNFSRVFYKDAGDSIKAMISSIYRGVEAISPVLSQTKTIVPTPVWNWTVSEYMQYSRENAMAVETDDFVFIWEDFYGITIKDFNSIKKQEPIGYIVGSPDMIGEYSSGKNIVYDFEWLTKNNKTTRDPMKDATIYAHSLGDNQITRITEGEGNNIITVSRSGSYSEMTYRNGYEEADRLFEIAQYDGYAKCKMYGDFTMRPSTKLQFTDVKEQYLTSFYVDEVIHEVSNTTSQTTIYMFTNSLKLNEVDPVKVR
ncbi:baseplate hub subunit [Shewanella phage Thanatos-1]|nr:baseplate hub subunit [Shewanella phage Thanatos-1]